MSELVKRSFIGDGEQHYATDLKPGAHVTPEPYRAEKELRDAVNVALFLRRPLLLEGDPGCGKTRLAYAVAYELGYPLKTCYIKSTSRATDLLYEYDAVRRLYDIQEHKQISRRQYVKLGRLGEAIALAELDIPSVVLIDEIDKADIDFPNDLLQVLDRYEFDIPEVIGEPEVKAEGNGDGIKLPIRDRYNAKKVDLAGERRDHLPLVIVTSNREKELPKPFLRRCLYYYIRFPRDTMNEIIKSHFQKPVSNKFPNALRRFWDLRDAPGMRWNKTPSTSELLDWLSVLDREDTVSADDLLSLPLAKLPYLGTLVKNQRDQEALEKLGS